MNTVELQRTLEALRKSDPEKFEKVAKRKGLLGLSLADIEDWRRRVGGVFGHRNGHRWRPRSAGSFGDWRYEITSDWAYDQNIVVNTGLTYLMNTGFDNGTDIDTWYVALFTNDYTPVAGDTYASNGWTEASGTNLDETVRQAWVEGNTSGTTTASIDNSASAAVYTGDNTFTAYGAILLGGGSTPTTLGDEAGGGTVYCASRFAASKAMTVDDTIEVTYTLTATDDGA